MRRGRAIALSLVAISMAGAALAQRMDPRRGVTVTVGMPAGASPMSRGGVGRTGMSPLLPASPLHVAWKKGLNQARGLDQAPIVGAQGAILALTSVGEAVFLDADGNEQGRVQLSGGTLGAPVFLGDGTAVVVASNNEAIGFKSDGVKWRTRLGGERSTARSSPLPLADGGVAVATSSEVSVLDASGAVRARADLPRNVTTAQQPDILAGPLLAASGKIYVATAVHGIVFSWVPGRDLMRVGSFGGVIDGGAALAGEHTLVAMVDTPTVNGPAVSGPSRLVALDLDTGVAAPRATAPPMAAYLGPPTVSGGSVYALAASPGRAYVVSLDAAGQEKLRAPIPLLPSLPATVLDAGALTFQAPAHAAVLVDRLGAVAFASPDGGVGVVDPTGRIDMSSEQVCPKSARTAQVVGLTAAGPGGFLVACASGNLLKITSAPGGN